VKKKGVQSVAYYTKTQVLEVTFHNSTAAERQAVARRVNNR
jgi:hypothetical protein